MKTRNLLGHIFGRLTVIAGPYSKRVNDRSIVYWECKDSCGNRNLYKANYLLIGDVKSCGCLKEVHGMSKSTEFRIWQGILSRCTNEKDTRYEYYGGRGIGLDPRYLEPDGQGFLNFLKDVGKRPKGKTIDRVNNNRGYWPNNMRWATNTEQASNRRSSVIITHNNKTRCQSDWAKELGISSTSIWSYLKKGMSFDWIHNHFREKVC